MTASGAPDKLTVMLVGFGGPENFAAVRPFIEAVVQGRNVPAQRIDTVVEQYRLIGGGSPYNQLTKRQAETVRDRLRLSGTDANVEVGFLHSQPTIAETVSSLPAGARLVVAIMAPHRSAASYSRYVYAVLQSAANKMPALKPVFLDQWHRHPLFIEALTDRIAEQLQKLSGSEKEKLRIIFSAHSIPQEMSDESSYAAQIEQTASDVFSALRQAGQLPPDAVDFIVAYQSRSGSPQEKWLTPDVVTIIKQSKTQGRTALVVAPIGFLVDHVEVLYDLDVLAADCARSTNIKMLRAGTVGAHPRFIELIAAQVQERANASYAIS